MESYFRCREEKMTGNLLEDVMAGGLLLAIFMLVVWAVSKMGE